MNHSESSDRQQRCIEKLVRDMGTQIMDCLQDEDINEVMLNPDGGLWVDTVSGGMMQVGHVDRDRATTLIYEIAGLQKQTVSIQTPRLETELPHCLGLHGERFTAQIPPIVASPCFTIRKKSRRIFSLDDYVQSERMTLTQATLLKRLIIERKNILVAGSPGSGKTTVTNAFIDTAVKADPNERFIVLEDVPELQCAAKNKVPMLTSPFVSMTELLRTTARMRPDRILVGEVRGAEAFDMLKAWNMGCSGGIGTLHANGVEEAIQRVLDLAMEAGLLSPPISLVRQTLNAVVFVNRQQHRSGFIQAIGLILGYENQTFQIEHH